MDEKGRDVSGERPGLTRRMGTIRMSPLLSRWLETMPKPLVVTKMGDGGYLACVVNPGLRCLRRIYSQVSDISDCDIIGPEFVLIRSNYDKMTEVATGRFQRATAIVESMTDQAIKFSILKDYWYSSVSTLAILPIEVVSKRSATKTDPKHGRECDGGNVIHEVGIYAKSGPGQRVPFEMKFVVLIKYAKEEADPKLTALSEEQVIQFGVLWGATHAMVSYSRKLRAAQVYLDMIDKLPNDVETKYV